MSHRKAKRNNRGILTIEGHCVRPTSFSYHDLGSIHEYYQVQDIAKVDERLKGTAVRLRKLIDLVGPEYNTQYITVESEDGQFSASLPIEEVSRTALVVYAMKKKPLEREEGGPVRFIIPFFGDKCANVKGAVRMVLSEEPGKDTRPSNAKDHAALHDAEKAPSKG
jgi:DMSO/TMAO reductase YedYZ molybdopterin-dependent catalytic subunit